MAEQRTQEFRIVIVDDAEFSRRTLAKILNEHGYTVETAESAEEALRIYSQQSDISLFLIDVVMPNSSGFELAQKLNELRYKGVIVMMSSLNMDSVVVEALSVGSVDFLRKPFSSEELLKTVKKVEEELSKGRI